MRKLIILPGSSPKNISLNKSYSEYFSTKGFSPSAIEWSHWKTGKRSKLSRSQDESKVKKLFKRYAEEEIYVIAKSLGTIIISNILDKIKTDNIKKIILMGLPLSALTNGENKEETEIYKSLNSIEADKILIIQADKDPYASFNEIEKFVRDNLKNDMIKTTKIMRDDHIYPIEDISLLNCL